MSHTTSTHPYDNLTPDHILDALESRGFDCDGRLLALNSYENRVYQVGLTEAQPVVAKFYRPGRWDQSTILEEHEFALELADQEIPVVAPLADADGATLHQTQAFLFAVYPRSGGRWPELATREQRLQMGRFLGRLHAVGACTGFRHRPRLDSRTFGREPRAFVLENHCLPEYLVPAYSSLTEELLDTVEARFATAGTNDTLRLHGDCHPGNILWTETGPHFVDLDDCRSGPAVQDIWMLLSGDRQAMTQQLADLLEGYQTFRDFDFSGIGLIEALRTLRIIHYAAWIARRWDDPAFPRAFPWFDSPRFWEEHILALREQAAALQEPPLQP